MPKRPVVWDSLKLKFQIVVGCLKRCWELNVGHMEEQHMFFIPEPFLVSLLIF